MNNRAKRNTNANELNKSTDSHECRIRHDWKWGHHNDVCSITQNIYMITTSTKIKFLCTRAFYTGRRKHARLTQNEAELRQALVWFWEFEENQQYYVRTYEQNLFDVTWIRYRSRNDENMLLIPTVFRHIKARLEYIIIFHEFVNIQIIRFFY